MTSSNGNIFRVTGDLCGEFTSPRWIPRTKSSDAELWCFLWSASESTVSKQWWGWWFETLSRSFWRHCNDSWQNSWTIYGVLEINHRDFVARARLLDTMFWVIAFLPSPKINPIGNLISCETTFNEISYYVCKTAPLFLYNNGICSYVM